LKVTRAFSPLSLHLSYKAEKSAAQTGGSGREKAGSPTLVSTPPLTTPAQVGEAREVGGGEGITGWGLACPAGSPATPEEGEAAWRGARRDDRPAAVLHPPPPEGGGETDGGAGSSVEGGGPTTTGVSSELTTGVSSELTVGGGAGGKKTHSVKKLPCIYRMRKRERKNVHCVKNKA
jgi:hypothetical protein